MPVFFAENLERGQLTQGAYTLVASSGQERTYEVNAPVIPTCPALVCVTERAREVDSSQMKGGRCTYRSLSTLLHYGPAPGLYYSLA